MGGIYTRRVTLVITSVASLAIETLWDGMRRRSPTVPSMRIEAAYHIDNLITGNTRATLSHAHRT